MRHRRCIIVAWITLLLLAFSPVTLAEGQPASWTILVYLDADNNLEREAIDDFLEMAAVGSTPEVNIVVQFDRIPGYDSRYGDWTGTMRFHVAQGMTPEPANAMADLGEANMGDPQTLVDFVTWGMATFPAQRTAVVLWNHGDGWRAANFLKQRRKAICWDDTNGRDALDLLELKGAMASVTAGGTAPLDLLAFDACLMAMIEIDAQIQPYVDVRVASESTEPGTGYPFDAIMASLRDSPDWDAAELGRAIVERYYEEYNGETQSAMDLGDGYLILTAAVDQLARALLDHQETQFDIVRAVRLQVQAFHGNYVDLYDFCERLAAETSQLTVQDAAQAVMDAIQSVTLAERHGRYWPGAHGISINFPSQASNWDSKYSGESNYLTFTAETHWDDFLMAYLELASVCGADDYEPDNDAATATPTLVGGEPQRHSFCPATDDADWVAFQAQAGQTVVIETLDLEPYSDTVLRLYDRDGQTVLDYDDDSGVGWASRIGWTSPVSGTFYVQVSEYFGRAGPNTGYTLRIEGTGPACQPDEHEPDNDLATASTLAVDGPAQGHNFCPEDDLADWISFQATQGQTYQIETYDLGPESDTALALYDMDGETVLLTDDDGGEEPGASLLRWTAPASGPYFCRAYESHGRTGEHTGYQLSISTVPLIVRGEVQLQGRTAFSGTLITVEPVSYAVTTAVSGTFALTATLPCTVTASHPGYLTMQWVLTETTTAEWVLEPAILAGGDINSDRRIDILDIAYIAARFGGSDPLADITADGLVDIRDLVLPAANFGKIS